MTKSRILTISPSQLTAEKKWIKTQLKKINQETLDNLIKAAVSVRKNAYQPYSHYSVGAAILAKSGAIYASCNAETASFTETEHAERSTIAKAISQGEIKKSGVNFIKAVAVSHQKKSGPCGGCRQSLFQHCRNCLIIDLSSKGRIQATTSLKTLLPYSFSF